MKPRSTVRRYTWGLLERVNEPKFTVQPIEIVALPPLLPNLESHHSHQPLRLLNASAKNARLMQGTLPGYVPCVMTVCSSLYIQH
jgi:hypothetical protein